MQSIKSFNLIFRKIKFFALIIFLFSFIVQVSFDVFTPFNQDILNINHPEFRIENKSLIQTTFIDNDDQNDGQGSYHLMSPNGLSSCFLSTLSNTRTLNARFLVFFNDKPENYSKLPSYISNRKLRI